MAFGFHPYFGLEGPRGNWRLGLLALEAIALDARMLPTGERSSVAAADAPLGLRAFDHAYALQTPAACVTLHDDRLQVQVQLLQGYRALQIYAPVQREFIAIEPMTALTNVLVRRRELPLVAPGATYRATWRVSVNRSGSGARP